jgi:hypothetical protein
MGRMDTTQPPEETLEATAESELEMLAAADPADAPPIAEAIAAELSTELDQAGADR